MSKRYAIIIGITSIAAVSAIIYFTKKDIVIKKRWEEVADEGYETAYDILYPLDKRRLRRV